MARISDRHQTPQLNDLTPRNEEMVRGGDGDERKKRVNLGEIRIVKPLDQSSPYL